MHPRHYSAPSNLPQQGPQLRHGQHQLQLPLHELAQRNEQRHRQPIHQQPMAADRLQPHHAQAGQPRHQQPPQERQQRHAIEPQRQAHLQLREHQPQTPPQVQPQPEVVVRMLIEFARPDDEPQPSVPRAPFTYVDHQDVTRPTQEPSHHTTTASIQLPLSTALNASNIFTPSFLQVLPHLSRGMSSSSSSPDTSAENLRCESPVPQVISPLARPSFPSSSTSSSSSLALPSSRPFAPYWDYVDQRAQHQQKQDDDHGPPLQPMEYVGHDHQPRRFQPEPEPYPNYHWHPPRPTYPPFYVSSRDPNVNPSLLLPGYQSSSANTRPSNPPPFMTRSDVTDLSQQVLRSRETTMPDDEASSDDRPRRRLISSLSTPSLHTSSSSSSAPFLPNFRATAMATTASGTSSCASSPATSSMSTTPRPSISISSSSSGSSMMIDDSAVVDMDDASESSSPTSKRRRHSQRIARSCMECGRQDTAQWRRGPPEKQVLCNACGMRYARSIGKHRRPKKGSTSLIGTQDTLRGTLSAPSSPTSSRKSSLLSTPRSSPLGSSGPSNALPCSASADDSLRRSNEWESTIEATANIQITSPTSSTPSSTSPSSTSTPTTPPEPRARSSIYDLLN